MKSRVLLVEDEDAERGLMERTLSSHGHHVVSAATEATALAAFKRGKFDCLVLDYCLPDGRTGLDLARFIREMDAKVGIVIVTRNDIDKVERDCEGLTVWCVLQKPVVNRKLVQSVEDASELANMAPETESRFIQAFSVESSHAKRIREDLMGETGIHPVM